MSDQRFFNIGLPQLPTNTDPRVEPDLRDVFNAVRNLTYLIGQYGGFEVPEVGYQNLAGAPYSLGYYKRRLYVEATEAMSYGQLVNLHDSGGTTKARFANATNNTRPCHGINNTLGTCGIGDVIEVVLPGCYVNSISGMTRAARYFLDTNNGLINTAAPAVAGNIVQVIGFAIDTGLFFFFPSYEWRVI